MLSMPRIVRPDRAALARDGVWFPRWIDKLVDPLSETKNWQQISDRLRLQSSAPFCL
jgi:hypothetical protein